MPSFVFVLLLTTALMVSAVCAGIISGMIVINKYQLKRKAQFGDKKAKLVYALHAVRFQLMAILVILNIIANTVIVVLLNSAVNSALLAILFSTILILVFG